MHIKQRAVPMSCLYGSPALLHQVLYFTSLWPFDPSGMPGTAQRCQLSLMRNGLGKDEKEIDRAHQQTDITNKGLASPRNKGSQG